MKHIQTFESFINEQNDSLNESYNVLPSKDGTATPGQLVIIDKSSTNFTGPTFQWLPAKKGIVEVYNGSHGEESRLVVKCDEKTGDSAIEAAVKEFGSQSGDYNSLYKKVKDFLKKSV
jgi:hypothetical protein